MLLELAALLVTIIPLFVLRAQADETGPAGASAFMRGKVVPGSERVLVPGSLWGHSPP